MTAEEIFDQVVQYYVPNRIWDEFSGSMQMHTIFDDGISIEDLSINNKEGSYQSTRHLQDGTFPIGKKGGQAFFKVNGAAVAGKDVLDRLRTWVNKIPNVGP